jgi:hypothetical protein
LVILFSAVGLGTGGASVREREMDEGRATDEGVRMEVREIDATIS